MGKTDRRRFLKQGLTGICAAGLMPAAWKAAFGNDPAGGGVPSLAGRPLGRTGIETPLISLGAGEATSAPLIRAAHDAGIKLFFSATYYGRGNNERLVGEALRGLPRDSFVIGTAAVPEGLNPREGSPPKGLTAGSYMKTAEDSLKRFGLDHVDILLLPFAGKKEFITHEPFLEAMTELKKQGKIRFAGIATHGSCEEALRAAVDAKIYDVAMPAYNYRIENKPAMDEALAYAARAGLGLVAMKTTAGAARDKNRTLPLNIGAALKWVLQNPNIASIVSGMSSVEELRKNLAMLGDLKLTDQELKDLNLADLRSEPGLYCLQCRKCEPQCPAKVDIPALMRGYMYAYGYRHVEQAWQTVAAVDIPGRPCERCGVCRVSCTAGFDIKDRIRDIARLKDVPHEFIGSRDTA